MRPNQNRAKNGTFAEELEPKKHKTFRCSAAIAAKLSDLPSTNLFIEAALLEAFARQQAFPDPSWDYYAEWDALQKLVVEAGNAIARLSQYEEKGEVADFALVKFKQQVTRWLENFHA